MKLGLTVLVNGAEYRSGKPDIVVVYPDKGKYYLSEVISDECIREDSKRLQSTNRGENESRNYCLKRYGNTRAGSWAASIYCDLAGGLELFNYNQLMGINFSKLQRYAAVIYPLALLEEGEAFFTQEKLQFRSLNVADYFALTLFSQADSARLGEIRRFMQFLMANR
ncbi:MAG: hypothetical protein LBP51_03800 [Deferribacteraceae bacterium]|jgi:hypothetical protein|nr:hypothetical protein [Deferribacteraceae bacterium]